MGMIECMAVVMQLPSWYVCGVLVLASVRVRVRACV